MNHLVSELESVVARWGERDWPRPGVLLVAGSGLGVTLDATPAWGPRPLSELVPFAPVAIPGHDLTLEILEREGRAPVLYQRGRLHAYQGFTAAEVVFVVRLAALLGAHTLVVTNAAGGLYQGVVAGDLAIITDQLNLTGRNPLLGAPPESWGPRFPDMVGAYDPLLVRRALELGEQLGVALHTGVYAGLLGPSYETPAEISALTGNADLVGMSTVLEVIAARHMGMRCLGMSLVTNPAAGLDPSPLEHDEVIEVSNRARERVQRLLSGLVFDAEIQRPPSP